MSALDNLKDIFSIFGKKLQDVYVGIDIGSSSIKITQLKKEKGKILLETYGEVALGPYQKEDGVMGELTNLEINKIKEALLNLIKQANVTANKALVSISSATSLIFILKLPKVSQRDLAGVIRNEAQKYIPVPLTEVTLDWWVIPEKETYREEMEDKDDDTNKKDISVLIAIVRNEIIDRYNNLFTNFGKFSERQYEIETFSAIRGCFKHELAPVVLIDFGASGIRTAVIEHGVIRKFHSVSRGSAYLTSSLQKSFEIEFEKAEKIKREVGLDSNHQNKEAYNIINAGVNYIFSEIRKVIFGFEKEYEKPINKIILTGGGSQLKEFREKIESKYAITTVFADPFSKVISPDFLEDILIKAGPEFAISLGLALQSLE